MATVAQPEVNNLPARVDPPALPAREPAEVNFGDLMGLAKELVPTGLLPKHIKTVGQCAAIILTGRELGMGPMRALRSLQMVEGKVVESADSQLARFKTDGGRAVFQSLTEKEAVLWLRHPNGDEHVERFTMEDAARVGLANKDVWKKYPKAMLRSRVITAGLKSVGWEGGAGNYDPEEAASSFAPNVIVPEPAQTVEAVADEVDAAQSAALAEIEALLPSLTVDQQIFVREKLSDGADPVKLLELAKQKRPGDAPSEKQVAFYTNLANSNVFTELEKRGFMEFLATATRQGIKGEIDRLKKMMETRKSQPAGMPAREPVGFDEMPVALSAEDDDLPF